MSGRWDSLYERARNERISEARDEVLVKVGDDLTAIFDAEKLSSDPRDQVNEVLTRAVEQWNKEDLLRLWKPEDYKGFRARMSRSIKNQAKDDWRKRKAGLFGTDGDKGVKEGETGRGEQGRYDAGSPSRRGG